METKPNKINPLSLDGNVWKTSRLGTVSREDITAKLEKPFLEYLYKNYPGHFFSWSSWLEPVNVYGFQCSGITIKDFSKACIKFRDLSHSLIQN